MGTGVETLRRAFLFTDIEGSTRLWDAHPDAMLAALDLHDRLLADAMERHGGLLHRHTGDGMVIVFDSAAAAIAAAIDAQRSIGTTDWAPVEALRVRMGVHTGEVILRDGEFNGWALNVASRLHALAHGGQVVVSDAAVADASGALDPATRLTDVGMHRLRDVARPLRIYSVLAEGMLESIDGLRAARPLPMLPRSSTTFVGRGQQIERVVGAVREHGLVTLVGVPGVGKTRLAVEAAARAAADPFDGAALVELAGVTPSQFGAAMGAALGVERRSASSAGDSVVEWLYDKSLLVVLDGCDDLMEEVAAFALAVAASAPGSRLLATRRAPLHVPGEHVVRVHPFGMDSDLDDGVALFLDRVRAAGGEVGDDAESSRRVREVCEAVAGVPLAIEIAASTASTLSLLDVLDAIRTGELLGRGGERSAAGVVDEALGLTYRQLDEAEREAVRRCSVFVGSFDRTAFAAVAAPGASSGEVLRLVGALVDRSVLVAETRRERTRFRLLEPVRAFAAARATADELAASTASFVQHYTRAAETAADKLRGSDESRWVGQVELDFDNLRAAHSRALAAGHADPALRIVASLWDFAFMRMRSEIFDWGEAAVDAAAPDHPLRAEVLGVVALGGWLRDDPFAAQRFAGAALEAERAAGIGPTLPARLAIMNAAEYGGATTDVRLVMAEVVTLSEQSNSAYWTTNADVVKSLGQSFAGRSAAALELANRAMRTARGSGNPSTIAWASFGRGVATELVDAEFASTLFDDALAGARSVDNRWIEAMCSARLVSLLRRAGATTDAMAMLSELFDTWERAGHRSHLWAAVRQAALCLADAGRVADAITLHEAVSAAHMVLPGLPADHADLQAAMSRIAQTASAEDVQRWARRADGLDLGEAVRLARGRLVAAMAAG